MEEMILRVDGLVKRYGDFALKEITFSLPRGYIMGIVGQNGAGKSTTIKCIMDLISFEAGSISLFGEDCCQQSEESLKERIGYVSEELNFYEEFTVSYTGKFVGSLYSSWNKKLFTSLLDKFGVPLTKKVKELSRGMKVKLSLALALAHEPELLLLDEPTSGLDPVVRSELLDILREWIQDGRCSVLFSSHITSDIEKIADYITVLHEGRIVLSEEAVKFSDSWLLVKAENRFLHPQLMPLMTGLKQTEFGFSAAINDQASFDRAFRSLHPTGSYKKERLALDELLVRIVKEGEVKCLN